MEEVTQLLKIEIDQKAVNEAINKTLEAKKAIQDLKDAQKILEIQGKQNSKEYLQNSIQLKALNDTVRINTNVVKANEKAQQASAGSITQLREQLKVVSAQWADLSKEERENTEEGKKLSKQKLELTERLKAEEKATGDTRRNVGNYTEGVKDALKQSGLFGQTIGALEKAHYSYTVAMKGATLATSSFKKVLISTGIGAIIVLIGSLISFLTRFQDGIDKVSQAFAGVNTFINVFLDGLGNLGKQIVNSVMPTLGGLGKVLTGIWNRDLSMMKEGFRDVKQALSEIDPINIIELGKQAAESAQLVANLTEEMQQIKRAEIDLNVERAKSRALINQLRRDSQDETKDLKEREQALKQAVELEQKQLQQLIDSKQRQLEITQAINAETVSGDKEKEQEAALEIEIAKLQEESLNKQIELNAQLRGIEAKREAERLKAIQAENEAQQKLIDDSLARIEAELNAQQEAYDSGIESAAIAAEEITRIEIAALQERFLQGLISKEEYEQGLTDIESAALVARGLNAQLAIEEANSNLLLSEAERVKIITDAEEEIRKVKEAQTNAAIALKLQEGSIDQEVSDNKINLAKFNYSALVEIFGRESAAGKAFASFQALIDTRQAAIAALGSKPFTPFNFIQSALVTAQGLATVARINSTPEPQAPSLSIGSSGGGGGSTGRQPRRFRSFADGGYTGDGFGSPDSSGFKPAGIVHEGEYVVKKSLVENPSFSSIIGTLESARLKGYAGGGFVGRTASGNIGQSSEITMLNLRMEELIKRPAIVQVSEINRVQGQVVQVANSGTLG